MSIDFSAFYPVFCFFFFQFYSILPIFSGTSRFPFSQNLDPQVNAPSASPRYFCCLSPSCYIRHFSPFVDCPKYNSVLY